MKNSDKPTCGDNGGHNKDGEPCGYVAGWGTDFDEGKCKKHRGTSPDGESHEDNTNRTTHGAYTDTSNLYEQEFSDRERDLVDQIEADYIERYTTSNGHEPTAGEEFRMFKMAVNAVTEMRVENWYTGKPDELGTGTPLVERETHISESGQKYYRYKKSPAAAARKHLEGYNRQWGKTMGLFDDPESAKAEATGTLTSALQDLQDE